MMDRLTLLEELRQSALDHFRTIRLVVDTMTLSLDAEERLEWLCELERSCDAACAALGWLLDLPDGPATTDPCDDNRPVRCQWELGEPQPPATANA